MLPLKFVHYAFLNGICTSKACQNASFDGLFGIIWERQAKESTGDDASRNIIQLGCAYRYRQKLFAGVITRQGLHQGGTRLNISSIQQATEDRKASSRLCAWQQVHIERFNGPFDRDPCLSQSLTCQAEADRGRKFSKQHRPSWIVSCGQPRWQLGSQSLANQTTSKLAMHSAAILVCELAIPC